jgi:hypothetical protein
MSCNRSKLLGYVSRFSCSLAEQYFKNWYGSPRVERSIYRRFYIYNTEVTKVLLFIVFFVIGLTQAMLRKSSKSEGIWISNAVVERFRIHLDSWFVELCLCYKTYLGLSREFWSGLELHWIFIDNDICFQVQDHCSYWGLSCLVVQSSRFLFWQTKVLCKDDFDYVACTLSRLWPIQKNRMVLKTGIRVSERKSQHQGHI